MKINKQITIDSEIMEKLRQEENASALIERLLRDHYQFSVDKKKNFLIQKQMQLKNFSKVAKMMRKEVNLLKKVEFLKMDQFSIRWLRGQDQCPGHWQIINYKKGRDLAIPTENFEKAWEVINKNGDIFEKI
jgi:hypothetical protein